MEIRGMRMIRMKCLLLMAVLLMIPHPWAAAQEEYIFGGSKNEILNGVAVSEDDRILMTGYTASPDGTLAGRTKKGHSAERFAWIETGMCCSAFAPEGEARTRWKTRFSMRTARRRCY